jgi:hypothetical protein
MMTMTYKAMIALGLMLVAASCEDEIDRPCASLTAGLIALDETAVRNDIDGWLAAYDASNANGHEDNIAAWVQSLRDECGFDATLTCVSCIETFPPQSEVLIRLDSSGVTVDRTLDIFMPDEGPMTFRAIHP